MSRSLGISLMLALSAGAGCGEGAARPTAAVQALGEAVRSGDGREVWKLVGPRTRRRLEVEARRAEVQAGRRHFEPSELVAVGWTPPRYMPVEFREIAHAGDTAVVEVLGPKGERERVDVVREKDGWKVELP